MPQPDIYGPKADRLTRLAVLERSERAINARKETSAPPLLRLALAAIGGIFLCMAKGGAIWAWLGAACFMLAACGAGGLLGTAAGAIAATIACFRAFGSYNGQAVFWLILCLGTLAGAAAGALISVISRRLPPQAFPFVAALLPAGFEHLASFGANGPLVSTALTQYAHPAIICIGRLGGLAGVTYVIFLFGAAVAIGVRYIRSVGLLVTSTLPPVGVVLVGLLFGAISSAGTDGVIQTAAFNLSTQAADRQKLFSEEKYDAAAWDDYIQAFLEQAARAAGKQTITTAIEKADAQKSVQLLVWPEAAVAVDDQTRPKLIRQIETFAGMRRCVVVAAFYDTSTAQSVAVVAGTAGTAGTEYARRRFVSGPDDEIYGDQVAKPGTDLPRAVDTPMGRIGAILSLDANNFENFASIARDGGNIACVCGADDKAVSRLSIELMVYNAALSGLAVMKSARTGTILAISPDGKILDRKEASGKIEAQVRESIPLGEGRTFFLIVGNLFAWLALLSGVGAGLYASTLPPGEGEPQVKSQYPRQTSSLSYKTKEGIKDV